MAQLFAHRPLGHGELAVWIGGIPPGGGGGGPVRTGPYPSDPVRTRTVWSVLGCTGPYRYVNPGASVTGGAGWEASHIRSPGPSVAPCLGGGIRVRVQRFRARSVALRGFALVGGGLLGRMASLPAALRHGISVPPAVLRHRYRGSSVTAGRLSSRPGRMGHYPSSVRVEWQGGLCRVPVQGTPPWGGYERLAERMRRSRWGVSRMVVVPPEGGSGLRG